MSSRDKQRPYKLWSCDRKIRKALVVSSLRTLKEKGCKMLGYEQSDDLKVFLESDGTEIENEVYFRTLDKDTILLLARPGERWHSINAEYQRFGCDESDNPSTAGTNTLSSEMDGASLLNCLKNDIGNLLLLNNSQMEQVAAVNLETMLSRNNSDRRALEAIQEACDRILTEKQEQKEQLDLLRTLESLLQRDSVDSYQTSRIDQSHSPFECASELHQLLQQARGDLNNQNRSRRRSRSEIATSLTAKKRKHK